MIKNRDSSENEVEGQSPSQRDCEHRQELIKKYLRGLESIWCQLIDEGPESGNPLLLFQESVEKTETGLAKLLDDESTTGHQDEPTH